MDAAFFTAKNGSQSCRYGTVLLHSSYDPEHEAGLFVSSLICSFNPSWIIITEPGLSYIAPFLRKRFPSSQLCAVRYDRSFSSFSSLWDKTLFISSSQSAENIADLLYAEFGEETLCSSFFAPWKPSSKIWHDTDNAVWTGIESAVKKSRDVLFTRSYFSSRWICNSVQFCRYVSHTASVSNGTSPVVICASGPSLESALPYLSELRSCYFLIAVSSAVSVLLNYGIIPDMCISTDGGYWARFHLRALSDCCSEIPVALTPESSCDIQLLSSHTVIPLSYSDGSLSSLASSCGFSMMHAERNGTVSGTAAEFALSITSGPVFFCGLDLSSCTGFQHARPNMLDAVSASADNRLRTCESRITSSRFSSGSLDVYRNWFAAFSRRYTGRLFRLSDGYAYAFHLGAVSDTGPSFFRSSCSCGGKLPVVTADESSPDGTDRLKALENFIDKTENDSSLLKEFFPAEYTSFLRSSSDEERKERMASVRQKKARLLSSLRRLCP